MSEPVEPRSGFEIPEGEGAAAEMEQIESDTDPLHGGEEEEGGEGEGEGEGEVEDVPDNKLPEPEAQNDERSHEQ